MGALDQISQAIGSLQSSMENMEGRMASSSRDRANMQDKLDEIADTTRDLHGKMPQIYTKLGELEAITSAQTADLVMFRTFRLIMGWITKRFFIMVTLILIIYTALKTGDWTGLKNYMGVH